MAYLIAKYLVTALVVVVASEMAKRNDKLGAMIGALPLVAIMVMVWLHVEHQGNEKIGTYAFHTFWYVLPTVPMFLLMPWLMSREVNFWVALIGCALLSTLCFVLTALVAKKLGIDLIP